VPYKCVYCGVVQEAPFKREHVIPRGIGTFRDEGGNEFILTDKVCSICNNELGICEGELCYAGPEAMFRRMAGIKGRSRKEKNNPFYSNRYSREPIRLEGRFRDSDFPALFEIDPHTGLMRDCSQMVFINPTSGQWEHIRLEKGMKKEDLVAEIKRKAGRTDIEFNILYDEKLDVGWLKPLLGDDYNRITLVKEGQADYHEKIDTTGIFTITEKHHRAIAKIAFNYMMVQRVCGISGYEYEFEAVRNFIRYGKGHPNDFVRLTNEHVLENADIGWRPGEYGHIVTCSVNKIVYSCVHLFTGKLSHGTYKVRLGRSPYTLIQCSDTVAHWFRITSRPKDDKDSGEIIPVTVIRHVKRP